jgi:uncharacterized protein (TIGR03435 family)
MRTALALVVALGGLVASIVAQTVQTSPAGPIFDVVSIKPSAPFQPGGFRGPTFNERPDGGFTMTHVAVPLLLMRAYPIPGAVPGDIVGLPEWTTKELFDISATSTLTRATLEDRISMLRAMLADRFKLTAHIEQRPQQVFELVLARGDRRLGKGLTPIEADCAAQVAARRVADEAARNEGRPPSLPRFDPNAPPPPCTLRSVAPRPAPGSSTPPANHLEGETAMADLALLLRVSVGRAVVDKTGLGGSYRVAMDYDMFGSRRGPDVATSPDGPPSVFTALQEQLGLKLQPATAIRDTLIIDRLERPSEN